MTMYQNSSIIILIFLNLFTSSYQFSTTPIITSIPPPLQQQQQQQGVLSGNWLDAKQSLRNPKCCVVSIQGINQHLLTLQEYFCNSSNNNVKNHDLDLRLRVRCSNNNDNNNSRNVAREDCRIIYNTVMNQSNISLEEGEGKNNDDDDIVLSNPCILALEELARGVASLADGSLEKSCTDVHMRIVFASNYKAVDPMFHTDKCPLRGYVTLVGPGTEYMDTICTPLEYAALRSLGVDGLATVSGRDKVSCLKIANELEFIVMKGDHYDAPTTTTTTTTLSSSSSYLQMMDKIWSRSAACVHRSPPGLSSRRVIISLDLADGGDDQEWTEIGRKRGWRSGMTQRKSHLVS